nr:hypothetical protein [Campylobacter cuniculorum]
MKFLNEILNIIKQWIPYIKILSPKYLQIKLNELLKQYLEND